MQVYLVGGAVRDQLLNYPVKDKDYVVTGATIEQMLELGYQQVGQSFPVFLHPTNKQEYALARTERKQGSGYTGFTCEFTPDITLEEDLLRRDLTINAMAMDDHGKIYDPFDGQSDLKNKLLRHVSDAFIEDPLRVLRVARFAARYHHLGFKVAPETLSLMTKIVEAGEVNALVAERVWQETESALKEQNPQVFFEVLRECGALKVIMPELDVLWGVPNPPKWHPEIDTGIHTMLVVKQAQMLSNDLAVRFASLCHDFGKGLTNPENYPHHRGHEKMGLKPIKAFCQRLRVPNEPRDLALLLSEFHTHTHRAFELRPDTLVKLFNKLDAWRKPQRFEQFLVCCTADMRGRTGFETAEYKQTDFLRNMFKVANSINIQDIVKAGFQGAEIREQLNQRRVEAIADAKKFLADS
ncbi:multifunctional CCA addition/repair protein [Psychrosphaera haliotis]|uniref:Multifunctional CCA protein n=1 Tax=Psychrosphaera haliotis TaxID=555083 RepID=A0A6N8F7Y9_9GAMM|nr:multifunctional CCA addition/repair protein [Psychrosphaera haliotis]